MERWSWSWGLGIGGRYGCGLDDNLRGIERGKRGGDGCPTFTILNCDEWMDGLHQETQLVSKKSSIEEKNREKGRNKSKKRKIYRALGVVRRLDFVVEGTKRREGPCGSTRTSLS